LLVFLIKSNEESSVARWSPEIDLGTGVLRSERSLLGLTKE